MLSDFTGKNILITGGSRGIGRACAGLFSSLGANVIITYQSNLKEAEGTLSELVSSRTNAAYQLDLRQPAAIEVFYNNLLEKYDGIDVLVNNAGVFKEHKISDVSYKEWQVAWQETMDTNLTGAANLTYFVARGMIERGGGKIVSVSSRGAFRGEPDHPAYGASKAGLNAMCQSLAVALAPHNITVGIVAPGFVETDMVAGYLASAEGEGVKRQSPLNRVARPDEVARVIAVFASGGFEFMTGGVIDVNGASYLRT
jgi:NAD(P)-dependent dehydrogenase (short-subunit alcohol dehydrogenase family)